MKEKKVCVICGNPFVPRSSLQIACNKACIKEKDERRKRQWQFQNREHRKQYMKEYQLANKERLSKQAVIRVREWRKKNKRRYQAQTNEKRFDGKWLKTMDKYDWQCTLCPNDAQLIHHKDRDTTNNDDNNLVVLCRACHVKAHYDEIHAY